MLRTQQIIRFPAFWNLNNDNINSDNTMVRLTTTTLEESWETIIFILLIALLLHSKEVYNFLLRMLVNKRSQPPQRQLQQKRHKEGPADGCCGNDLCWQTLDHTEASSSSGEDLEDMLHVFAAAVEQHRKVFPGSSSGVVRRSDSGRHHRRHTSFASAIEIIPEESTTDEEVSSPREGAEYQKPLSEDNDDDHDTATVTHSNASPSSSCHTGDSLSSPDTQQQHNRRRGVPAAALKSHLKQARQMAPALLKHRYAISNSTLLRLAASSSAPPIAQRRRSSRSLQGQDEGPTSPPTSRPQLARRVVSPSFSAPPTMSLIPSDQQHPSLLHRQTRASSPATSRTDAILSGGSSRWPQTDDRVAQHQTEDVRILHRMARDLQQHKPETIHIPVASATPRYSILSMSSSASL